MLRKELREVVYGAVDHRPEVLHSVVLGDLLQGELLKVTYAWDVQQLSNGTELPRPLSPPNTLPPASGSGGGTSGLNTHGPVLSPHCALCSLWEPSHMGNILDL